jgi:acyl carrier protein
MHGSSFSATADHDRENPMDANLNAAVTVDDVKAVVVETLGVEDRAGTLDASTPLLGSLPELDSMAVLELVMALQERFDIAVEDEDITAEVFETVASLTAFVVGKVK